MYTLGTGWHRVPPSSKKNRKSVKTNANAQQYSADGDKQYYLHVKELEHLKIAQSSAVLLDTVKQFGQRGEVKTGCTAMPMQQVKLKFRAFTDSQHSDRHRDLPQKSTVHLGATQLYKSLTIVGSGRNVREEIQELFLLNGTWRKLSYVRCAMSWSSQWSGKWQIVVITSKYFTTMLKFPDSKACKTVPFICAP